VTEAGAEAEDYVSAAATYRPRNAPFGSVGELRLVLGLSRQDFSRLEPHVTVFNISGRIDPFSAARPVLLAVPELTPADAAKLLKAQTGGEKEREDVSEIVESHADYFGTEPSGVYRVTVQASLATGSREAAQAVIIAPVNQTNDFGVVSWSRLASGVGAR
jgi:general secretion pathway protein K